MITLNFFALSAFGILDVCAVNCVREIINFYINHGVSLLCCCVVEFLWIHTHRQGADRGKRWKQKRFFDYNGTFLTQIVKWPRNDEIISISYKVYRGQWIFGNFRNCTHTHAELLVVALNYCVIGKEEREKLFGSCRRSCNTLHVYIHICAWRRFKKYFLVRI